FILDSLELSHRQAQVEDDLRVAQANLEAQTAQLRWQAVFNYDQGKGALPLYYEALGDYLREQAQLDLLTATLQRADAMRGKQAVSPEEYDRVKYSRQGQEQKLAKLRESLEELRKRADQTELLYQKDGMARSGLEQLRPFLAKIDALRA